MGPLWAASFFLVFACGGDDSTAMGGGAGAVGAGAGASGSTGSAGAGGSNAGASGAGGSGVGGRSGGSGGVGGSGGAGGSSGAGSGGAGASGAGGTSGGAAGSATPDASLDARQESGPVRDAPSDASTKGEDGASPPSDAACGALPTSGLYATFRVGNDVFHVWITNANGINQAIALWRGQSMAKIPAAAVDCANGTYNCGYSWRMKPDAVEFAEITIEVCDGTPSYVEGHCADFARAYCPWSAELTELRDCRTDPSCPMVSR
jgi:hypothetical protein